jgi:hypothetical protein
MALGYKDWVRLPANKPLGMNKWTAVIYTGFFFTNLDCVPDMKTSNQHLPMGYYHPI